jgi:hypothetical protein
MHALSKLIDNYEKFARQPPGQKLATVQRHLVEFGRKSPRERLWTIRCILGEMDWYWKVHRPGNDRTAYVIGLFGSGRNYLNELMQRHIGERSRYVRQGIRFRRGRTSMVYTGHATVRYVSRFQALPAVTRRVLEAARSGLADVIFIYRHPLDSLLTNWVWWRIYIRDNFMFPGISQYYRHTDDLCVDLEENFSEFKAFAEGDSEFFAPIGDPRFLSFAEFIEETQLFLQSAILPLRLEDFSIDPLKEFTKIARVMSVDLDLSLLRIAPPKAKPYRYLAVKEKVPRFRDFINDLDLETRRRIEKIGYEVCG